MNIAAIALLRSNGFTLDMSAGRLGHLAPSNAGESVAALRARFDAEGYVWIQGLLPRQDVLDFRRDFFSAFTDTGLLARDSDPAAGIAAAAAPRPIPTASG